MGNNIYKSLSILTVLISPLFSSGAQQSVYEQAIKEMSERYTTCIYTDINQNEINPMIYKTPPPPCGTFSFGSKNAFLCQNYITCGGPNLAPVMFSSRCWSDDGKTCPSAIKCRDAIGPESYEVGISGGKWMLINGETRGKTNNR